MSKFVDQMEPMAGQTVDEKHKPVKSKSGDQDALSYMSSLFIYLIAIFAYILMFMPTEMLIVNVEGPFGFSRVMLNLSVFVAIGSPFIFAFSCFSRANNLLKLAHFLYFIAISPVFVMLFGVFLIFVDELF